MRRYVPSGSVARVIAYLRTLPPGGEATTPQLAEVGDFHVSDASAILSCAMRHGWVEKRTVSTGGKAGLPRVMLKLGQAAIAYVPQPPKVKAARLAKPVANKFNARINPVKAPDLPVVVPENVKRTYGPNFLYDTRYTVDPCSRPFGAGFCAEWDRLRGRAGT